jgi:peptide/nickel transport system ATP-binding protein/oligopeptide transport system ATP-binding protein
MGKEQAAVEWALLEVKDLQTSFFTERGTARAVDGVSFRVPEAQVFGIVGESGCGKSMTALSIMRLIPSPPGRIVGGEVRFDGTDLLTLSEDAMQSLRGNQLSMIFQEPMTSLNPVFRVGDQIAEVIERHRRITRKEAIEQVTDLLDKVGIPTPAARIRDYPHQMSGGMRQRVMIAMALACRPRLIIADEPTTALDVTIQAQILDLLRQLQEDTRTTVLLITHDLGVIAELAEQVLIMYAGRVVEEASVRDLFHTPLHPYTQGLLRSIPGSAATVGRKRLEAIQGVVPSLFALPPGCKFNTRCPQAFERCFHDPEPDLLLPAGGHPVRCWLYAP